MCCVPPLISCPYHSLCVQVFLETGGGVRDVALTKELNPATLSFDQWVDENKEWLISSLFTPK